MKLRLLLPLLISLPALAQPKAETVAAFDRYVATAEQRIAAEEASPDAFLRINSSPFAERGKAAAQLRNGEVLIEKVGNTPSDIPGGMIHDWIGTAFIPSTTVADVLATVQDYDHLAPRYRPESVQEWDRHSSPARGRLKMGLSGTLSIPFFCRRRYRSGDGGILTHQCPRPKGSTRPRRHILST